MKSDAPQYRFCFPVGPVDVSQFERQHHVFDRGEAGQELEGLEHDFSDYMVVISLNGDYSDYIEKMPFHTSALNWPMADGSDLAGQYRDLRNRITDLVELLAGPEAIQD